MSAHRPAATLQRVAFKTSRLAEFVGVRELTAQTGHPPQDWPLVILKELVDNALDECEEAEIAPEISVRVSTDQGEITVSDNGRGMPAETLCDILDYSSRTSSREAYVSPTRGAQGNALKTLLAMPRALHGSSGTIIVEARDERHTITCRVDQLRQEPVIDHQRLPLISLVPRLTGVDVIAGIRVDLHQHRSNRRPCRRIGGARPLKGIDGFIHMAKEKLADA